MPFLAYVAIVLVSLGGILFELDWLTKPKLETKAATQVAVASSATPVRAVPKVDGPNEGPSPVVIKKPEAEQVTEPPPAPADQTAGTAPPVTPAPFPAAVAAKADIAPQAPPQAAMETNGAAPQPQAQPVAQPAPVPVAAKQAPNICDVQGCAGAYQSFRASDCTYQPMEGPRKVCEKPPIANQRAASVPREPTVRRPSRDAELRDVERTVRSITAGDDADADPRMGRSQVIVIERPDRDW